MKKIYMICLFLHSIVTTYILLPKVDMVLINYLLGVILMYSSYLIILRLSKVLFIFYISILSIFVILILPTILLYGEIGKGMLISLFETNLVESKEYLLTLPFLYILYSMLYFLFSLFLIFLAIKNDKFYFNKKILTFLIVLFSFLSLYNPILKIIKTKKDNINYFETIYESYNPLGKYLYDIYFYFFEYKVEKEKILSQSKISHWNIISSNPKYKNYVVVIGESARRDYLSVYGYQINTTPFLNSVNGLFFRNYISAAAHTVTSLRRMLIQNERKDNEVKINEGNNIVSLANKAGFKTYWLSNQGFIGKWDSPISIIASPAKYHFYANHKDSSESLSDRVLLPIFDKTLSDPVSNETPRMIFIHLIGSHANFCSRITDDYKIKPIYSNASKAMSCYLTSLKQTDEFLKEIYTKLKKKNESFSLMYFSDHGLAHTSKNAKNTSLRHGDYKQSGYRVPMLILSSDDKNKSFINAPKSGFNFVNHFSKWAGIKEKSINNDIPFFFTDNAENIKVFNWQSKDFQKLEKDNAFNYMDISITSISGNVCYKDENLKITNNNGYLVYSMDIDKAKKN